MPIRLLKREYVHQSNLIEGFDSRSVDDASLRAWENLRHTKVLTHEAICKLQKRLTAHQPELNDMWRGAYRNRTRTRVWVNGQEALSPAFVGQRMDIWLNEQYPTLSPKESHILFEKIHPFVDGNGRVGRMLMWLKERELGLPYTLISYDDREQYYQWFN